MTMEFRTRPIFLGDCWSELRDAQADAREETIAAFAGRIADTYLRAALVVGRDDDPVAEALRAGPFLDMRSLIVHHDYLAGFWRWRHGHLHQPLPGIVRTGPLVAEWRTWLDRTVALWFVDHPHLVRLAACVVAESLVQRVATVVAEMELWEALREAYPLLPPEQLDLFEDEHGVHR